MQIKSTHYLPIPGFCQQLLNSYFPTNFSPELQKYNSEQIGFDWKLRILWIWSCPVSTKELFLKIAVPEKQTKSLKSTCEVVSFYYIFKLYTLNLLRTIFSQAFLKDFAKITCDFPLYGIVKNLIIYFAEAFRYFSHYQFTTLIPFSYQAFGAAFFYEYFPVVVSVNTCLKVTPRNLT